MDATKIAGPPGVIASGVVAGGSGINNPAAFLQRLLDSWSFDELAAIAEAKRFWEQLLASTPLRESLRNPSSSARQSYRHFAPMFDGLLSGEVWSEDRLVGSPEVERLRLWREQLSHYRHLLRVYPDQACAEPRFVAWRAREMARAASELGARDAALAHPVVAYELSSGCTLGCWFCGISAEKFRGYAAYATHGQLWRDILAAMTEILGPAAQTGVCFGATDPFDNPDYDLFIRDHYVVTGRLPSTTTAAPLRDLCLTRAMLERCAQDGPIINRFSILTDRILEGVLTTFTPLELLLVELIPQMSGSLLPKADAGRARNRRPQTAVIETSATTIACVSGFMINLPERRIRLVSPCRASDTWPMGYRVYADLPFADGAEFRAVLLEMIETFMAPDIPLDKTMRFRADLRLTSGERAVRLQNDVTAHDITGPAFVPELAGMLFTGERPLREVIDSLVSRGAAFFDVLLVLQRLYDAALLDRVGPPSFVA